MATPIKADWSRITVSRERLQLPAFCGGEDTVGATEVATFAGKAFATPIAPAYDVFRSWRNARADPSVVGIRHSSTPCSGGRGSPAPVSAQLPRAS